MPYRTTLAKLREFLIFFVVKEEKSIIFVYFGRYMNAEKYNLDRIYFGGCFIRGKWEQRKGRIGLTDVIGHAATISTLSYAIRFWSKGTKRALFLRHEGFL